MHFDPDEGMEITLQAAENLLTQDAGKALEGAKESSPILKTDEENRLVAIADFLFHLGIGNYRKKKHLEKLNVDEQEECSYRKKQMGTCWWEKRLPDLARRKEDIIE